MRSTHTYAQFKPKGAGLFSAEDLVSVAATCQIQGKHVGVVCQIDTVSSRSQLGPEPFQVIPWDHSFQFV